MNTSKLYTLLFAMVVLCFSNVNAQTPVELQITHKLGGQQLSTGVATTNNLGNNFTIERLEYYISKISITHDGGMTTDVTNHYILADGFTNTADDLGSYNITAVEAISFYIGVDTPINHADPSLQPTGHPLAPRTPSMHWGWASGYRFVAMEGKSGISTPQGYEVHALGDQNYNKVTLNVNGVMKSGKIIIPLQADYAAALKNIDVSAGLVSHGDGGESVTLLNNFSTDVFSAGFPLDIEEAVTTQQVTVYPNPSTGVVNVHSEDGADITVYDIQGRIVTEEHSAQGSNTTSIRINMPGMYMMKVQTANGNVTTHKLQIL